MSDATQYCPQCNDYAANQTKLGIDLEVANERIAELEAKLEVQKNQSMANALAVEGWREAAALNGADFDRANKRIAELESENKGLVRDRQNLAKDWQRAEDRVKFLEDTYHVPLVAQGHDFVEGDRCSGPDNCAAKIKEAQDGSRQYYEMWQESVALVADRDRAITERNETIDDQDKRIAEMEDEALVMSAKLTQYKLDLVLAQQQVKELEAQSIEVVIENE